MVISLASTGPRSRGAEIHLPYGMASERLGLSRFGFPPCPTPPLAKLQDFSWHGLSETLAMSSLRAVVSRGHIGPRI
jgi:hypothetical protein